LRPAADEDDDLVHYHLSKIDKQVGIMSKLVLTLHKRRMRDCWGHSLGSSCTEHQHLCLRAVHMFLMRGQQTASCSYIAAKLSRLE
jgi:hypothetical protein